MKSLRTWAKRIVICLLAGAAVSLLVAVGCALAAQQWPGAPAALTAEDRKTLEAGERFTFMGFGQGARMDGFGYRELHFNGPVMRVRFDDDGDDFFLQRHVVILDIKSGWPFKSLHHRSIQPIDDPMWMFNRTPWPGVKADAGQFVVPRTPIWSGLLFNALLYALLLLALVYGPRGAWLMRRRLRERRGLCPACAYPVGIRDFCTECGSSLPPGPAALGLPRWFSRLRAAVVLVCACLIAGALINVLVMIVAVAAAQHRSDAVTAPSAEQVRALCARLNLRPLDPRIMPGSGSLKGIGYREIRIGAHMRLREENRTAASYTVVEIEAGWPMRSFRHEEVRIDDLATWRWLFMSDGVPRVKSADLGRLLLPRQPMWRGLAVNSLLYAALVGIIFAAAARWWRKRSYASIRRKVASSAPE